RQDRLAVARRAEGEARRAHRQRRHDGQLAEERPAPPLPAAPPPAGYALLERAAGEPDPVPPQEGQGAMTLSGKERAALRSECNRLKPTVHVGQEGITPTLVDALDDALRTRELVKVALNKGADVDARDAAGMLAGRVSADVIQ